MLWSNIQTCFESYQLRKKQKISKEATENEDEAASSIGIPSSSAGRRAYSSPGHGDEKKSFEKVLRGFNKEVRSPQIFTTRPYSVDTEQGKISPVRHARELGTPMTPGKGEFPKYSTDLLVTFISVLRKGTLVKLYRGSKKPRTVLLGLGSNNETLNYTFTGGNVLKKLVHRKKRIALDSIHTIYEGKQTSNFLMPSAFGAKEEHCLSLITSERTLDLETNSEVERNALVDGLSMLLQKMMDLNKEHYHSSTLGEDMPSKNQSAAVEDKK
eukprot:CAMPEP_0117763924 /NCGR_PEP_ID=MMETSP0947-20121206/19031_1 /TAXON_ID=44440 /ORGANISM="Chattonella subsalsa, Strain CCMP2191" /LENGTH=269 /DNA_ID=CAMNT_0005585931 /DNA_START=265 /DNA_END=1074 /DNA_ORIENTATION=+